MDDRGIIDLYWARNQQALAETAAKYGSYCAAVADNILHDSRDAEECVNDTWLGAWNAMPPQRPERLRPFLARMTRNLAFDRWRTRSAQKRGGGELPLALDRDLFLRRYFYVESAAAIAKRYGLGRERVSMRLLRTRKKLKAHLTKEGYL